LNTHDWAQGDADSSGEERGCRMSWLEDLELGRIIERKSTRIYILLMSIYLLIGILYVLFGTVNNDEGWYLYASKLVYAGKIPYVDFSYTQGPLLPYVYGIPQLIFGPSLYVGRLTSLFFGLLTCVFTAKLAEKLAGKTGAVVALALVCLSPFTLYFFTIVKTYALTSCLMILSLYLLFASNIRNPLKTMLSMLFMCLAAGVRVSVLPVVFLLMIYFVYAERNNMRTAILGLSTVIVTCGLLFAPFLLINKDLSIFNLVGYHLGRAGPQSLGSILLNRGSAVVELVHVYFLTLALVFVGLVLHTYGSRERSKGDTKYWVLFCLIVLAVCAVNFFVTPTFSEYAVILAPVASVLASLGIKKIYDYSNGNPIRNVILVMMALMVLLTPLSQGPLFVKMSLKEKPIAQIEEIGYYIKSHTPEDGRLLMFSTYAAIAADRMLLPGFEMSIFSYYSDWSTDKARQYHVINRDLLNEYIESTSAAAILLTSFEIEYLQIGNDTLGLIEENYYLAKSMPNWGQWGDTADLYLPRQSETG
jgi:hypothetical protein